MNYNEAIPRYNASLAYDVDIAEGIVEKYQPAVNDQGPTHDFLDEAYQFAKDKMEDAMDLALTPITKPLEIVGDTLVDTTDALVGGAKSNMAQKLIPIALIAGGVVLVLFIMRSR